MPLQTCVAAATILSAVEHATAAAVVDVFADIWKGPGVEGGTAFPLVNTLIILIVTVVVSGALASVAAWKHVAIENGMHRVFEVIGRLIGRHPVKVIVGGVFFALLCSGGMPLQEADEDPSSLWVPKGSVGLDHRDYVRKFWQSEPRENFIAAEADGGANILTPANLKTFSDLHEAIMAITVSGDDVMSWNPGIIQNVSGTWTFDGRDSTREKVLLLLGRHVRHEQHPRSLQLRCRDNRRTH